MNARNRRLAAPLTPGSQTNSCLPFGDMPLEPDHANGREPLVRHLQCNSTGRCQ